eukprot:scaffold170635_cov28-Tisochrysis_lutea.AAC.5
MLLGKAFLEQHLRDVLSGSDRLRPPRHPRSTARRLRILPLVASNLPSMSQELWRLLSLLSPTTTAECIIVRSSS